MSGAIEPNTIFESMIINERRALAHQLGVRVADLEDAFNLELAIGESRVTAETSASSIRGNASAEQSSSLAEKTLAPTAQEREDMQEPDDEMKLASEDQPTSFSYDSITTLTQEEQERSRWWLLPTELSDRILLFVGSVDMLGYLHMVAKTNGFKPSEAVYKRLAEIVYPSQFGANTRLQTSNWGDSWRNLLVHRPRIRTNGFYTLRTMYSKAPTNDSFDEPKIVGSIESVFHRHFRFFDTHRVLYSPSLQDAWDISDQLYRAKRVEKHIYLGQYSAKGRLVTCVFTLHYCTLKFVLEIRDGCDSYSCYPGKHSVLRILEHSQITPGRGVSEECLFPLPINCDCRFWREWHFDPRQEIL